ncbi:MAG: glycerol-3-phosphate dehydrogenase/oxidase [Myxococcota bacterium]
MRTTTGQRSPTWRVSDRHKSLDAWARTGADVVVIGGGISGAGVLREFAYRGLRALLIERDDFASGASSASSKLVHGGLRYLSELNLRLTRTSIRERELLVQNNPNLIRELPFLLLSDRSGLASIKLRAGLRLYGHLSGQLTATGMLPQNEWLRWLPTVGLDRVRAIATYHEAHVDDARLVLATLKDARSAGGEAINHCPAIGFCRTTKGRITAVRVYDQLRQRHHEIRCILAVNTSGVDLDRVRGFDAPRRPSVHPTKGTHVVIPRERLPIRSAIAFPASDGRHLFAYPIGDAILLGTTDTSVDDTDALNPSASECRYLLAGLHRFFPTTPLDTTDVWSAWSGVRPLMPNPRGAVSTRSVSREHRIEEDDSGLLSMSGGKLTTFRAMAEQLVDRALARFPDAWRASLRPSRTATTPLRQDDFDRHEFTRRLRGAYQVTTQTADRLIRTWGSDAFELLRAYGQPGRARLGDTDYRLAELRWAVESEAVATLSDLLERRIRVAHFTRAAGAHLAESAAAFVADAMGWDAGRQAEECRRYRARVAERFCLRCHP